MLELKSGLEYVAKSGVDDELFGVQIYLILEEVFNDVVLAFSGFQLFACFSCDTSFFRFFSSNQSFRCLLSVMLCDLFYLSFLQYHSFFLQIFKIFNKFIPYHFKNYLFTEAILNSVYCWSLFLHRFNVW